MSDYDLVGYAIAYCAGMATVLVAFVIAGVATVV